MTYPPQPPGQPGPYGPQDPYGNQGQWGQQPGGGYPGGGYPSSGPQPQPGYPGSSQQFGQPDPWGQQPAGYPAGPQPGYPATQQFGQPDPWAQQPGYANYPGGPENKPPGKRLPLILAIVAAVVLVGAGVTAIVLLTGKGEPTAAPPGSSATSTPSSQPASPSSAASSSASASSSSSSSNSSGTGAASPEELQAALVDAYNTKDAQKFVPLECQRPSAAAVESLQHTLDQIPDGVVYSVSKPPVISGNSGTLTLQAAAGGRQQDFPLPITKTGGRWCVAG